MRRIVIWLVFWVALLSGMAMAETPQEAGQALLGRLKKIDEEILGKNTYQMRTEQEVTGTCTIDIGKDSYQDEAVYVVQGEVKMEFKGFSRSAEITGCITAGLHCKYSKTVDSFKDSEAKVASLNSKEYKFVDGKYIYTETDNGEQVESKEVPYKKGMQLDASEMLIPLFLGSEKDAKYAFNLLSGENINKIEFTVAGEEEITIGGTKMKAVKIVRTSKEEEKSEGLCFWIDSKRRLVKMGSPDQSFTMELVIKEEEKGE